MSDEGKVTRALRTAIRRYLETHTPYDLEKNARIPNGLTARFLKGERGLSLILIDRIAEYLDLELVQRD